MRTSNEILINNISDNLTYVTQYNQIIDKLVTMYPVSDGSEFGELVNFKTNKNSAKHNWYDYKHGYAEQLIRKIIEAENPDKLDSVLDPFCGVGTTNLTAQEMGYKSIGFDINPLAILATKVKTHYYSDLEIIKIEDYIANFVLPADKDKLPHSKVVMTSYTPDVLDTLLKIKFSFEQIKDINVQNFLRLAFISIIGDCSLKVKDGNGLKLKKNYKPLENLIDYYLNKCLLMLLDVKRSNNREECKVIFGSMLNEDCFSQIINENIGLCIFSPPYANCFDYCEVYKLEFWLGGFVKSYDDFKIYRSMAMRSHVNSKFDNSIRVVNKDVEIIANLISTYNIWNKNIPNMLRGYFDDMNLLLQNLKRTLKRKGKCYIVVANSGYKGILVPTDLLIADIAKKLGFDVNAIYYARQIRASSQQMQLLNCDYNKLMRESIIELQLN